MNACVHLCGKTSEGRNSEIASQLLQSRNLGSLRWLAIERSWPFKCFVLGLFLQIAGANEDMLIFKERAGQGIK